MLGKLILRQVSRLWANSSTSREKSLLAAALPSMPPAVMVTLQKVGVEKPREGSSAHKRAGNQTQCQLQRQAENKGFWSKVG